MYRPRQRVDKSHADYREANIILNRLDEINNRVIIHLKKTYKGQGFDVDYLDKNYNGGAISENPPGTKETSYVLNKGDVIKLCIRDAKTGKLHDINTLTFVSLHELSHMMDKKYGHTPIFWDGFRIILGAAVDLGLYIPVDYSIYPTDYCGIQIKSSPLFKS